MKPVKKTSEYTIYQKRSGRYAVQGRRHKMINGDEKTKILLAEGLIKQTEPRPKQEEAAEGGSAEGEAKAE